MNRLMRIQTKVSVVACLLAAGLFGGSALAKISEPDHVFYGTATWFGEALPAGTNISLRLDGSATEIASYVLGQDENLGGLYALRVPMDSLSPRLPGRARPGEGAAVFINNSIVANVLVGEYGEAQRLDIDPAFLAGTTPAIVIGPAQVLEGNSGTATLLFDLNLTITATDEVTFDWATSDDTASGVAGACDSDSDYVQQNGSSSFAAGETSTSIAVTVCGDTLVEDNETLVVELSNPLNAIIQFQSAEGTILNDDGQPEIVVADLVVAEPASGQSITRFEVMLTRSFTQDVEVDYEVVGDTAVAGLDFTASAGRLTIPAGSQSAFVDVTVLADGRVETPEAFKLVLSNPLNGVLSDSEGLGVILDADTVQQNQLADSAQDGVGGVEGLAGPSDVVFSPDDGFLYVSTLISKTVVAFGIDGAGSLTFLGKTDSATSGFETGLFDGLQALAMRPDGEYFYAAASAADGIMVLSRDPVTGSFSLAGTISNGDDSAGTPVTGLGGVWDLVISADGNHLYAAGADDDSIAVFGIDASSGLLTFIESESNAIDDPSDPSPVVSSMDRPVSLQLSADGSQLLVAADFSSALVTFSRQADSAAADFGRLSFSNALRNGASGVSGIGGASAVTASPDGGHVYVLGRSDDTVAQFSLATGTPTFDGSLDRQTGSLAGLDGPDSIDVGPAGSSVYAVGFEDSSFVRFSRVTDSGSPQFGVLDFQEIFLDETDGISTLGGPTSVQNNNSGDTVVVAAGIDNAINVFNAVSLFSDGFETP